MCSQLLLGEDAVLCWSQPWYPKIALCVTYEHTHTCERGQRISGVEGKERSVWDDGPIGPPLCPLFSICTTETPLSVAEAFCFLAWANSSWCPFARQLRVLPFPSPVCCSYRFALPPWSGFPSLWHQAWPICFHLRCVLQPISSTNLSSQAVQELSSYIWWLGGDIPCPLLSYLRMFWCLLLHISLQGRARK